MNLQCYYFKMKLCSQQIYFGDYLLDILLLALAILQQSKSAAPYNIVSMNEACSSTSENRNQIRLSTVGSNSAASLLFDVLDRGIEPRICAVDIHAANTHVISLQLGELTPKPTLTPTPTRDVFGNVGSRKYHQACPLSIFSLGKGGKVPRLLRSIDLCNTNVPSLTLSELYTRHHLTIIWMPPHSNFTDRIQVSELIVTAVGIGTGVCKKHSNFIPAQFPCWRQYSKTTSFCIATELICDGRRNCPNEGEDEDPALCAALKTKHVEIKSQNVLQKMTANNNSSHLTNNEVALHDENEAVEINHQWNVTTTEKSGIKNETESFPEALAHYGPWGYLMLGMLICGTVLMVCGVWECCCRRHKTPTSTPSAPNTIFVITPEYPQEETSLPPAYDDLDQPPAYNILFPSPYKVELPTVSNVNEVQRTET